MPQDYSRQNLRKYKFKGQDLAGANFRRADLRGANFKNANLDGANFSRADLRGANFKNANLDGANFNSADIRGNNFTKAKLARADFSNARSGFQQHWLISFWVLFGILFLCMGIITGIGAGLAFQWRDAFYVSIFSPIGGFTALGTVIMFCLISWFRGFSAAIVAVCAAILAVIIVLFVISLESKEITVLLVSEVFVSSVFMAFWKLETFSTAAYFSSINTILFSSQKTKLILLVGATFETIVLSFYLSYLEIASLTLKLSIIAVTLAAQSLGLYLFLPKFANDKRYAGLQNSLFFVGTSFHKADLTDAQFVKADLSFSNFVKANLTRTRFTQAKNINLARVQRNSIESYRERRKSFKRRVKRNLLFILKQFGLYFSIFLTFFFALFFPLSNRINGAVYLEQGWQLQKSNQLEEAIAAYQQAIQLDPTSAAAHHGWGKILKKQEKYEEAVAQYRRAIELDSKQASYYKNLGFVLYTLEWYEEAAVNYRQSIQLNSKDPFVYFWLGVTLRKQRKFDDAIAAFHKSLQLNPKHANTYFLLGYTLEKKGNIKEAFENYSKAIKLDPKNSRAYHGLGYTLEIEDKLEAAKFNYRQAIKFDREWVEPRKNIGRVLQKQEKFKESLSVYCQAFTLEFKKEPENAILKGCETIQRNPKDAKAYTHLSFFLIGRGERDAAIAALHQAMKTDPKHLKNYYDLGSILTKREQWDKALAVYQKALEVNPQEPGIYIHLGDFFESQDRLNEAIVHYQKAIQLDPKAITSAFAYFDLGDVLRKQGKLDEAVSAYRQAMQLGRKMGFSVLEIEHVLGNIFSQQGKWEDAVSAYRKVLQFDPENDQAKESLEQAQCQLKIQTNPELAQKLERLPKTKDEPFVIQKRSIVRIMSNRGEGTGWVVKRQGNQAWIVTNRHVVTGEKQRQPAEQIEVEFYSTPSPGECRKRRPAKLLHITDADDPLDLAVLEVTEIPSDIKPLPLATQNAAVDTPIYLIGHPKKENWKVSEGKILGVDDEELITSAVTAPGGSGSPALDEQNRVVGMLHTGSESSKNGKFLYSLALPSKAVADRLEQWGVLGTGK